jgi:hypothetical protein
MSFTTSKMYGVDVISVCVFKIGTAAAINTASGSAGVIAREAENFEPNL